MLNTLQTPPTLSTPDTNIFQPKLDADRFNGRHSDEQLQIIYEIERTIAEIRRGKWTRVALQFPDQMLPDAPGVFEALSRRLKCGHPSHLPSETASDLEKANTVDRLSVPNDQPPETRLYILADTSYGACCVDEIAAEHVNAEVVVHYGRACLSPTARLPVIYIFSTQNLEVEKVTQAFEDSYPDYRQKILLMADVTYSSHLPGIAHALASNGYIEIYTTDIIRNPSSPLPNRTVPEGVRADPTTLKEWQLFHISDPPDSLLLILSSRVAQIHIYPTCNSNVVQAHKPLLTSTALALRKRYALLTSASTVSIFGILINTLSVENYLHMVEHVKSQISRAGKKSYTFVVGKVNAAKVANFSEIGAWVVIGCWESSLTESKDFWKPILTPFELELALTRDDQRIWTGEWNSNFQDLLNEPRNSTLTGNKEGSSLHHGLVNEGEEAKRGDFDLEPESAPPEYDLRTGRYTSSSRPMQSYSAPILNLPVNQSQLINSERALTKRVKGDMVIIGGDVSPGAEYLTSKRTWKGLGSDFGIAYDDPAKPPGAPIEEGRSGIARGYTHSNGNSKR